MSTDHTITNSYDEVVDALQLAAAALQCVVELLPAGEEHVVNFTGRWQRLGSLSIATILERADTALAPYGGSADAG